MYKQLNLSKAIQFYNQNFNYSVYVCDPYSSVLNKISVEKNKKSRLFNFSYLINSDKSSIKISQFCNKRNNFDVVFISPDVV